MMRARKQDYIKAGLLITAIVVVMCLGGCFQQKTSVTVLDAQNKPIVFKSESISVLRDTEAQFIPDPCNPTLMTLKIKSNSSGPVDVALAGIAVLFGALL